MVRQSAGAPTSQMARALLGLRELLFGGEYPPGQRLSELPLVERLGVSRTPLRLALARLEHEGLIEALSGGGYVVRRFTRADIDDAIELRGVLEGTAARFAAERRPPRRRLERLRTCNDEIGAIVHEPEPSFEGLVRYMALNERFHALLVELADSEVVTRALEGVVALPFASASAGLVAVQAQLRESREILVIAHSQHRALIDAIATGEGTRAEAVAREHARMARLNLDVVLRHREMLDRAPGGPLVVAPTGR
jgi:GntR family transcriptional regulator, vanillate catabolism transcriptional regulator